MPTINNDTIYLQQYCTNYTWNDCIERTYISWIWKEELKQSGVEILTTCAVFICVVLVLVWFIKGIFRLIIPTKWKK